MQEVPALSPDFSADDGAQAARRLFEICRRHVEFGTRPIAAFLLSLHNASIACPDMYLLSRWIDDDHFEDVMTVVRWFRDMPGRRDLIDIFEGDGKRLIAALMQDFDRDAHA
ncbi:hypothetical protein QCE62_00460 [Caballeronia sp. LZ033]|uniref:DUF7673 family protein n=1 Tax=Caballeronia sp. LZ033 TaxID=3038566 RepID=UPI00285C1922|nr:hypothetical protein [Caballeronia sp. LZ033]MDR5812058.1 hypothetical protein [Caballeronia sp. LZ033]